MDDSFEMIGGVLVMLIFIVVVIGIILSPFIRFSRTGTGQHTGYITAVEQEGYFFPNYRVYVKTDNSSSQEDVYCMDRSKIDLASKAKLWSKSRKLVEVSFDGVRGIGMGLCHDIQITDIQALK